MTTLALIRKLLRDVRWPLVIVMLLAGRVSVPLGEGDAADGDGNFAGLLDAGRPRRHERRRRSRA